MGGDSSCANSRLLDNQEVKQERWRRRQLRNKTRKLAAKAAKKAAKKNDGERRKRDVDRPGKSDEPDKALQKKKTKKRKVKKQETLHVDENVSRLEAARFRFINEQLYTMSGAEAIEFFSKDSQAYEAYHKGYNNQVKKWPYNPVYEIIQWLKLKFAPTTVIADLGCGDAKIARSLENYANIHSFDLVALNDKVRVCDMAKVPLTKGTVDIVIFCLSLMGTNIGDFLHEANRILKIGGYLKIAEISSRFRNVRLFIRAMGQLGFEYSSKKNRGDGYFIMLEFVKKEDVRKAKLSSALKLKPCLYKKR